MGSRFSREVLADRHFHTGGDRGEALLANLHRRTGLAPGTEGTWAAADIAALAANPDYDLAWWQDRNADCRYLLFHDVAKRLRLREVDVRHLMRAGILRVHKRRQAIQRPGDYALFLTVDVDAVEAEHPELDWAGARAAGKGSRSPFANLPTQD